MISPSRPEKKAELVCTHCWTPVNEDRILHVRGMIFCGFKCLRQYHWCLIRFYASSRSKRFLMHIQRRKGWSTGLAAGLILSFALIGIFAFILSSPAPGPPGFLSVTDASIDIPFINKSPFFPNEWTSRLDQAEAVSRSQATGAGLKDSQKRVIKERVKISLVKDYPLGAQKTVGISGQASEGSICALYLNDALYEATTCAKGRFFFPRITLLPGKNMIEVVSHDPEGFIIPSNPIELFVDTGLRITEKVKNITRGDIEEKKVCLTFDGGASASCAPEILDILKIYNVKCTFFLEGDFIRNHPGIVKKMVAAGHEIGNHTDTHPHLARLNSQMRYETLPWVNKAFVQNQLKKAEMAFFRVTGRRMAPFWRAPYGEQTLEILNWAEEIGYTHVSWTCGRDLEDGLDTLDWVHNTDSPIYYSSEEIADKIMHYGEGTPEGANGGIILMHLATSRPAEDRVHRRLPHIIEGLINRGYRLSLVSDIIDLDKGPVVQKAENQHKSDQAIKVNKAKIIKPSEKNKNSVNPKTKKDKEEPVSKEEIAASVARRR
ncbi:polysaccharide deacetylase family protein [bacterium]|nr:polysaccharide deacetylase family protein [bacterium]